MKTEVYLALKEDKSFHTIIIKKGIGKFTYLAAIGYAGGQTYEEFYGKFWQGPDALDYFSGSFSYSLGFGIWDIKLTALKFNDDQIRFDAEIEDLEEFMVNEDEKIQIELIEELKKYIHYGYDDETEMEYFNPEAKPVDTSIFVEFVGSPGQYCNDCWSDEWLEITNSIVWPLSTRFPHVIDYYL